MKKNLFFALALLLAAGGAVHAGYWEAPTFPDQDTPPWNLGVGGGGDAANASITEDGFLRVAIDVPTKYHVYELLGQNAIDAGAGFETASSVAWRARVPDASPFVQWTTSFAAYAPSPTLPDKSDL